MYIGTRIEDAKWQLPPVIIIMNTLDDAQETIKAQHINMSGLHTSMGARGAPNAMAYTHAQPAIELSISYYMN